jgi:hypothetical protein
MTRMWHSLPIGILALVAGIMLLIVGRPNRSGESPRFLQSRSLQMFYPSVVLAFFALGVAELITWFVTKG